MRTAPAASISDRMAPFVALFLVSLSMLLFSFVCWGAEHKSLTSDPSEILRWGEKMYREGLLPSGEPMPVVLDGDNNIPGTTFGCVGCHLRSGIGALEGPVLSPPITGQKLYKPYYQYDPSLEDYSRIKKTMWEGREPLKPLYRPAYTDETLAKALREGINPGGRQLKPVMPRFRLSDHHMAALITYLKNLSAEVSPGVDKQYRNIRFATVIAGNVPAADRTEMLATLDALIEHHNKNARTRNRRQNLGDKIKDADFNYPLFSLSRWELHGPEATWRSQLDAYYRKEPVFALLGGLSATDWRQMHEFSEQNNIPCLLPITDLPVITEANWYTLYFNKGIYQEGEAAANYLAQKSEQSPAKGILQIVENTATARAAANGFLETWKELGNQAPDTIYLADTEQINGALLQKLIRQKHPATLLLWASSGIIPALESLAANRDQTKMVFVSAALLQHDLWALPEKSRSFTYISYPYRLDAGQDLYTINSKRWLQKHRVPVSSRRISTRLFSLSHVLLEPFRVVKRDFNPDGLGDGLVTMENQSEMMMHVKRNYYRDYLLDLIGMFPFKLSIDFERLNFGTWQRYISKGCYIVQLSDGQKPELIKKSDWVVH